VRTADGHAAELPKFTMSLFFLDFLAILGHVCFNFESFLAKKKKLEI
jgi:hypothetical protein